MMRVGPLVISLDGKSYWAKKDDKDVQCASRVEDSQTLTNGANLMMRVGPPRSQLDGKTSWAKRMTKKYLMWASRSGRFLQTLTNGAKTNDESGAHRFSVEENSWAKMEEFSGKKDDKEDQCASRMDDKEDQCAFLSGRFFITSNHWGEMKVDHLLQYLLPQPKRISKSCGILAFRRYEGDKCGEILLRLCGLLAFLGTAAFILLYVLGL
ncbi:hypothetical protein Tco_1123609 [Tanacetum coccineum]|uniref:Uncharacterized protein n=1 Tax=Tanacetum coccineum TaxID=301880 RepID=A0ABQ5J3X7_9ASTR